MISLTRSYGEANVNKMETGVVQQLPVAMLCSEKKVKAEGQTSLGEKMVGKTWSDQVVYSPARTGGGILTVDHF